MDRLTGTEKMDRTSLFHRLRSDVDAAEREFVVKDVVDAMLNEVELRWWRRREEELCERLEEETDRRRALDVLHRDLRMRYDAAITEARAVRSEVERELWHLVRELEEKTR